MSALQVRHRVLHTRRKWKEDPDRDPHPRDMPHRWGDHTTLCSKCVKRSQYVINLTIQECCSIQH